MTIFSFLLGDTALSVATAAAFYLAAAFVVGKLLKMLLKLVKYRFAKRTKTSFDDFTLSVLKRFVVGIVVLTTAYWVTKGIQAHYINEAVTVKKGLDWLNGSVYVLMLLYFALGISRLFDAMVRWYLHDIATRTETNLDEELAPLVNRIVTILVFVVSIIVILNHFHQDISTLVVSLGVGSLAIALAAQETLANMIAGFVLMIDRPFRHGDRVRLPNGTIGNVYEIGMRSTKVIDDNNVMIITPNAEIVKSQIWNFSYPNDIVRFNIPFSVAYGTNLEWMQALIIEAVNGQPDVEEKHTTEVRMIEMAESSIRFEAMVKIMHPGAIPRKRSDLMKLIHSTLESNNICIPFPQRVVHMAQGTAEGHPRLVPPKQP
jgi:MscS family membrane protein